MRNVGLSALVIVWGLAAAPAVAAAPAPATATIYAGVWVDASRPSTAGQFQADGTRLANPGAPWDIQADYALRSSAGTKLLLATYAGRIFVVDPLDSAAKVEVPPLPVMGGGLPSVYSQPLALGPNGTKIAYIDTDGLLHVVRADGSQGVTLPAVGQSVKSVSWSPDGAWLAVVSASDANAADYISVVRPDGTEVRNISGCGASPDQPYACHSLNWFPDSKRIAFSASTQSGADANRGGIYVADIGRGTVDQLYKSFKMDNCGPDGTGSSKTTTLWSVAVSPDGTQLAVAGFDFLVTDCSSPSPGTEFTTQKLWIVPASAGSLNASVISVPDGGTGQPPPDSYFGDWLTWGGRQKLRVVLVTGLRDSHPGVMPGEDCASAGSMATLCQALTDRGFPVYVPSSSADPAANAVITNSKGFDYNAKALRDYLSSVVRTPALLVGHSMGGIFSRIAVFYGAQAAGLFTIGSPFDGSFAADLAVGATNLPCRGVACTALRVAGASALLTFGPEAMRDLTSAARNVENLRLKPPGVKTWTFAGTACHPYGAPGEGNYLFPNDGVVGKSSAYGATANLGATTRSSGDDYHQGQLATLLTPICGSGGVELSDQSIVEQVLAAADQLDSENGSASAARAAIARAKPRRVVVYLQTATARRVRPGSKLSLDAGTTLLSRTAFALRCDGKKVLAMPALGGRVSGFPAGGLACRRATLSARHSVSIGIATDPDHVTATIVSPHSNQLAVTVSAKRAITRLVLSHGRHAVRAKQRRLSRRAVRITLTPAQAAGLSLTATVEHRRYATTIG